MYDQKIVAPSGAQVTFTSGRGSRTVDLYSKEGLELVASLWLKLSCEYRLMYELTWMGVPIIQLPSDIIMMQELIWKLRPDFIVECGLAYGGSAIMYASLCELMGKGKVIGIDIEVKKNNRIAIQNHPMSKRIEIVEGSSVDIGTVELVKKKVKGTRTVLVVLDSNHSYAHVLKELDLYHPIVTPDSYLVAMDGAQAHVWEVPRCSMISSDNNPLRAIKEFLKNHRDWEADEHYNRLHVTSNPSGFLHRRPEAKKRKIANA